MKLHTIEDIRAEMNRLDEITGVSTKEIELSISTKSVYQYGSCTLQNIAGKCVPIKISIAKFLLAEEEAFYDTVWHEYAHAVTTIRTGKNEGHSYVWKQVCREIGADPIRLAKPCESADKAREAKAKYLITCKGCDSSWKAFRATVITKAILAGKSTPNTYCARCGHREFDVKVLR